MDHDDLQPYFRFLEDADTPISLGCYLRCINGEWDSLAIMEVNPTWYLEYQWRKYYLDVQSVKFLSKCVDLPTSFDREQAALDATLAAEKQCCLTNIRVLPFIHNYGLTPLDEPLCRIIGSVKSRIARVLGKAPTNATFRFGKGSTLSDKRTAVTVGHKIASQPTLTSLASCVLPDLGRTAWGRSLQVHEVELKTVDSARFLTVPKNAKTDRGIEIQPSVNASAQLGLGRWIRHCLRRNGLDLDQLQGRHRRWAQKASIDGSLATIDLKSASDTIATNVVKLLLPSDWYAILSYLRVPIIEVDYGSQRERYRLERFSSMGNGFTFELETLLFWSIAYTVSAHKADVSVYGDDIICHTDDVRSVMAALRWFGFTPNEAKSFVTGIFRESCGGDFFDGHDVRPYYMKKKPNEPHENISLANGIRRASSRLFHPDLFSFSPFYRCWRDVINRLPTSVRGCRGPEILGDLCIHEPDRSRWSRKTVRGVTSVRAYLPEISDGVPWDRFAMSVQLAVALYGSRLTLVGAMQRLGLEYRNAVMSYRIGWVEIGP